jgi:endonuclease/exonuclease/phosphatase family metal-dependent hydrolase
MLMNNKLLRFVVILCIGVAIAVGCLWIWAVNTTLQPESVQPASFISEPDAPALVGNQPLKILNWNMQFMAGNVNNHFFFDNGSDSWPAQSKVLSTLDAAAALIKAEDPDVILLQEIDDDAKRTYYQDQQALLLERLPKSYKAQASTLYWQADFLPVPALWGSVGMKLSVISKYKIIAATRYALASIDTHNFLEQQFQPRRAILHVELERKDKPPLHILNTHLSAFAQGSNTMERQVKRVFELMHGFESRGEDAIIGGDFNLIPNRKAFRFLSKKAQSDYNLLETELKLLLDNFASVPSTHNLEGDNVSAWYTHSPNNSAAKTPNKTLDYFFMTEAIDVVDSRIRSDRSALLISDHMPVIATFQRP